MPIRDNQTTITLDYFIKMDLEKLITKIYDDKFNTWDDFFLYIIAQLKEELPEPPKSSKEMPESEKEIPIPIAQ